MRSEANGKQRTGSSPVGCRVVSDYPMPIAQSTGPTNVISPIGSETESLRSSLPLLFIFLPSTEIEQK